jgi:CheY-like chemotaxis protein
MQQSVLEIEEDVRPATRGLLEFGSGGVGPRMLIADDDPSIVRLLADHCARLGFNVETASNGLHALLKANRFKPDILMVDINMPEVDGLSVCEHLLSPERAPLDVIVITGSRDKEMLERCEGLGALYVRKGPNFWDNLAATLAELHPEMAGGVRQHQAHMSTPAVRKRPRVLLVDDDDEVNRFLASRLEKCGLEVIYATDATQGFRMACREDPAVIVADYFMPNGDAQYFLTKLRTNAGTGNVPVIVWSGRNLEVIKYQALQREICGHPGAAKIMRKSLDTRELFQTLKEFCGFEREPGMTNAAFGT